MWEGGREGGRLPVSQWYTYVTSEAVTALLEKDKNNNKNSNKNNINITFLALGNKCTVGIKQKQ